jgi:hypothetical protein
MYADAGIFCFTVPEKNTTFLSSCQVGSSKNGAPNEKTLDNTVQNALSW